MCSIVDEVHRLFALCDSEPAVNVTGQCIHRSALFVTTFCELAANLEAKKKI
jgi:hypothetical protein